MKTRQEKIEAIYKKIARKDLEFGCKFLVKKEMSWGYITFEKGFNFTLIKSTKNEKILYAGKDFGGPLHFTNFEFENLKIIGHAVMIGDVLYYLNNKNFHFAIGNNGKMIGNKNKSGSYFEFNWNDFRLPIEDQSDECIDFVYFLIK